MRMAKTDTSFIDGEGIAFIVYFQGCGFACMGCQNPDLRDFTGGYTVFPEDVLAQIDESFYDSVVFSGGEPLAQPSAVIYLANRIKIKKWLYTGYELEDVPEEIKEVFDVIVAGRYIGELKTGGFPSSSNQVVWRRSIEDDTYV